jgi:GrpB-like predicted nucleotidyltransferase (UPF0157 family)
MIVLAPYDPDWPSQFAAARAEMMAACAGLLADVHHVGSTAIAGLAAKPVIDMMPVLRRHEDCLACVAPMRALGYGNDVRAYAEAKTPFCDRIVALARTAPPRF